MPEFRPDLDHEAVLDCPAEHMVVTAPPGTGKTCLAIRLAAQIGRSLEPHQNVLVLTFSNQARTQLELEAARQIPSALRSKLDVTNYHRFFWRGVTAYRRALGLPMRLDVGSRRRRREALERTGRKLTQRLDQHEGLIESIAEHAFAEIHDGRTPEPGVLARLLPAVEAEQRAGRLVFDDLGALFWSLLTSFPAVDRAYSERYPVVIADEHQDASALQDALVRRLGRVRRIVFADEMQLIHEFRGASRERLDRHLRECREHRTLQTPHRWHGSDSFAEWLLAMRDRLQGRRVRLELPDQVRLEQTPADRGFNGMKPAIRAAVSRAFEGGAATVVVLARGNDQVAEIRSYLSRQGQYPRQVGTQDFEDARHDIEQLPLLRDSHSIALHALERLRQLVPTLTSALVNQVRSRLLPETVNLVRAGAEARRILEALDQIYLQGPGAYFTALVAALRACAEQGHHLPRIEAVRALRSTVDSITGDGVAFDVAVSRYADEVLIGAHTAPRINRGLFVMTAHQAKGKEFDAVVLGDAMARYWPDDEASRRLFYVVITRAARCLTIVAPDAGSSPLVEYCRG